jgi:hypothetical protein
LIDELDFTVKCQASFSENVEKHLLRQQKRAQPQRQALHLASFPTRL